MRHPIYKHFDSGQRRAAVFLEWNIHFETSIYEFQVTSLSIHDVLELNLSRLHLVRSQRKQRLCERSPYEHNLQKMMKVLGQHWPALGVLNLGLFLTGSQREATVQHNITQGLTINKFCILSTISIYIRCVIWGWFVSYSCTLHMIGIYSHF